MLVLQLPLFCHSVQSKSQNQNQTQTQTQIQAQVQAQAQAQAQARNQLNQSRVQEGHLHHPHPFAESRLEASCTRLARRQPSMTLVCQVSLCPTKNAHCPTLTCSQTCRPVRTGPSLLPGLGLGVTFSAVGKPSRGHSHRKQTPHHHPTTCKSPSSTLPALLQTARSSHAWAARATSRPSHQTRWGGTKTSASPSK